jgi:putative phosphoesterase
MRLALISDMHGNAVAFEAVLDDLDRLEPDVVVSLGDVAQGGAEPAQTLERLRSSGAQTVMGNSDDFLLEVPTDSPEPVTERQLEVREWTLAQLSDDDLSYLRSFEPTVELSLGGHGVLCFHGSPESYDDILLPEWENATLAPFEGRKADLLAGGHVHTQWCRQIGDALFVNPGSVGLAYDRHVPDAELRLAPVAEYALVFVDDLGLSVELRRVPYSFARLREVVHGSGRPYADEFAAEWGELPA